MRMSGVTGTLRHDWAQWLEWHLCAPGDDALLRQRKVQFTAASILVVPAGLLWSALYLAYGERTVAGIPLAYSVLTLLDVLVLLRWRHFDAFRQTQQLLILVLPFLLLVALGGFVGSSVVILWSFIAVLMALLFGGPREAWAWFVAYLVAVTAAAVLEPSLTVDNNLPDGFVLALFVLNIGTVSAVSFVVLFSFLAQRRRMRELEVAFLNQTVALRQSERLATLGTLVAGIAHELNNPAAASSRAAGQLRDAFAHLEAAHLRLDTATIGPAGQVRLRALEQQARERSAQPDHRDALARADLEAAVEEWLDDHAVADAWELAPPLVGQGLDPTALSRLAEDFEADALGAVLGWTAAVYPVYGLLHEIGQGTARISDIVGALKSYSYLGQAPVQAVDVHEGIENTLVILRSKLKGGITVHRDYGAAVPKVLAHGSELNQVWTNLIDNATDAMDGRGEITIRTRGDGHWAVVEIEDDGPGIPAEIQPRIFDPFFTTKAPGHGSGLGLSTSYAIITQKHEGTLDVESRPGFTRFTVKLPVEAPPGAADHPAPASGANS
jgi:signal transduction histidine kinase